MAKEPFFERILHMKKKLCYIMIAAAVLLAVVLLIVLRPWVDEPKLPQEDENNAEQEIELLQGGSFESIYYAGRAGDNIIIAKEDGIYLAPLSLDSEEVVFPGNISNKLLTDGRIVYFVDRGTFEVKCLDLETKTVSTIYKLYQGQESDTDDYFKDGDIVGFEGGFLYFEEWHNAGDFKTYAYNTQTGECKEIEAYLGDVKSYGGYIYYFDLRYELTYAPLYRAKADGSGEEIVAENVGMFTIDNGKLYYSEKTDGKTTVTERNLDTGEEKVLLSMKGIDVLNITGDVLHYRDSAGADYVYLFDGEAIDNIEGLYGIFDDRVITRAENGDGSVTYTDIAINASATIDDIEYAVNYFDGTLFYISDSGELKFKKFMWKDKVYIGE